MQMKNQTFINQLNKKLTERASGGEENKKKKRFYSPWELKDWKSVRTWDMHTSGVYCWDSQSLSKALSM